MSLHLKVFLLICLVSVLIFLIRQIKNKKLVLQYALSWMLLIAGLLIVVLIPEVLDLISKIIGIAVPVNTIFFMGFLFALIIIYRLTCAISKMSLEITRLTQEIGMLKKAKEQQKE